jgi:hypothetical protein
MMETPEPVAASEAAQPPKKNDTPLPELSPKEKKKISRPQRHRFVTDHGVYIFSTAEIIREAKRSRWSKTDVDDLYKLFVKMIDRGPRHE